MFPHHVFSLIELNQVRMSGGMSRRLRPIEFITISRHHTTGSAPTLTLIPRYYIPNPHILPTRASMKRLAASGGPYQHKTQSFKVTLMRYRYRNDYDDIDSPPIETIVSVKCLSHREVAYYQQQAGVPLLGTVTDSWKKQRRLKDYDDNRQMEKDIGQKHQTMGGHILVNVYGVAGLNVNGKWLVL
ncbi:hypothetical protein BC941DRAFT_442049 [Chlamydoabsidia padenii]|nr:hypothetical protein BC941DRAFT_442049 [Chlamydoabsidia padenii]